jgi:hypothetical protein
MPPVEIKSRVGADGVLNVSIPLGPSEANHEVLVTVESVDVSAAPASSTAQEEWRNFVESMAGCISDPTFRRHEQGEYETRKEAFS